MSCCVKGCGRSNIIKGVSYHRFPKEIDRQKKWLEILDIQDPNWTWTKHKLVCSDHFLREDFNSCSEFAPLRPEAVPRILNNVDTLNHKRNESVSVENSAAAETGTFTAETSFNQDEECDFHIREKKTEVPLVNSILEKEAEIAAASSPSSESVNNAQENEEKVSAPLPTEEINAVEDETAAAPCLSPAIVNNAQEADDKVSAPLAIEEENVEEAETAKPPILSPAIEDNVQEAGEKVSTLILANEINAGEAENVAAPEIEEKISGPIPVVDHNYSSLNKDTNEESDVILDKTDQNFKSIEESLTENGKNSENIDKIIEKSTENSTNNIPSPGMETINISDEINGKNSQNPSAENSNNSDMEAQEELLKTALLLKTGREEEENSNKIKNNSIESPAKKANGNEENADQDELDDDFDPSLLCPDISMDVDDGGVVTSNEHPQIDEGSSSPLPYHPIFSTIVDEMTGAEMEISLTPEEMVLRSKMFGSYNPVKKSKVHCTACNVHLGSALIAANNRFVHPLLKVLICKNCYYFYTSGEFVKDEDGSELYCRWCGQGGQVLCCSSCEFVFCKRCIRSNLGAKKCKEIRESDDWNCFRCEPTQLSPLRAACAEFMDYYKAESARVQSLPPEKQSDLYIRDYTTCCSENNADNFNKSRKRRFKQEDRDPDYQIREEPASKRPVVVNPQFVPVTSTSSTMIKIYPTQPLIAPKVNPTYQPQQWLKFGNTVFKTNPSSVGLSSNTVINPANRAKPSSSTFVAFRPNSTDPLGNNNATNSTGYIKIVPHPLNAPPKVVTSKNTLIKTMNSNNVPSLKHPWFEKTVRGTARVNSTLSYTLTQLSRQQAQAASVEDLATVHNKLQEVLSSSINNLIQIRKSLRTDFITGIKTVNINPVRVAEIKSSSSLKPPPLSPFRKVSNTISKNNDADDDDVIFINNHDLTSAPPRLIKLQNSSPKTYFNDPSKKSIIRRSDPRAVEQIMANIKSGVYSNPVPRNSNLNKVVGGGGLGGFLKVRSLTALQNVTSDCITIPDDPILIEEDPLNIEDPLRIDNSEDVVVPVLDEDKNADFVDEFMIYNINHSPTAQVKKMMNITVLLNRSDKIEEMLKKQKF